MGLTAWLARLAVQAPHVLVVETPGAWRVRVALHQELSRRGWRSATSPADADVLAVCGAPPGDYAEPLALTWDQLPGPRARITLTESSTAHVAAELDRAVALLLDNRSQRADAAARTPEPPEHDMEHGSMEHGSGGHDDMDMTGPGGIPLAAGGQDRDGLEMDVLHLRLGPVLPQWPAGLVLGLALQGDVVTEATVERVPRDGAEPQAAASCAPSIAAAHRCDAAATVLALAGAPRLAGRAYRARDQLLEPTTLAEGLATLTDLRHRVGRSAVLRWSLRDLAPVTPTSETSPPSAWRGDVHDRLLRLLDLALVEAGGAEPSRDRAGREAGDLAAIVVGAELATVRLAVASVAGLGASLGATSGGPHG